MGSISFLSEVELHGLVDGHIEADRRADVLRRLSASPTDRARVEAWQEQNDLIRAAFHEVEREPLPPALDLAPQPSLLCVSDGTPTADSPLADAPPKQKPAASRGAVLAGLATLLLVALGLGASWLLVDSADRDSEVADLQLRGTIDATLADRASAALSQETARPRARPASTTLAAALPTTRIPDLGPAGFSLTDAETEASEPASLVFHYRNAGAERIAISVARAPRDAGASTPPVRVGGAYSWHRQDNAFAIAGTLTPDRLRAIAVALQEDDGDQ